jgi:hypothetical protein
MPQTSTERARLTRDRRRRGVRLVPVEVSQEVVEFLEVNGYIWRTGPMLRSLPRSRGF